MSNRNRKVNVKVDEINLNDEEKRPIPEDQGNKAEKPEKKGLLQKAKGLLKIGNKDKEDKDPEEIKKNRKELIKDIGVGFGLFSLGVFATIGVALLFAAGAEDAADVLDQIDPVNNLLPDNEAPDPIIDGDVIDTDVLEGIDVINF